jgi:hypothetical protein
LVAVVDTVAIPISVTGSEVPDQPADATADVGNRRPVGCGKPANQMIRKGLKRIAPMDFIGQVKGGLPDDQLVIPLVDITAGLFFGLFGVKGNAPTFGRGRGKEFTELRH